MDTAKARELQTALKTIVDFFKDAAAIIDEADSHYSLPQIDYLVNKIQPSQAAKVTLGTKDVLTEQEYQEYLATLKPLEKKDEWLSSKTIKNTSAITALNNKIDELHTACDSACKLLLTSSLELPPTSIDIKELKALRKVCQKLSTYEALRHFSDHQNLFGETLGLLDDCLAGAKIQPAAPVAASPVNAPTVNPSVKEFYSLRRKTLKLWEVTYKGVTEYVDQCEGMVYLAEMLRRPFQPTISALDLFRGRTGIPLKAKIHGHHQPKDEAEWQALEERIKELKIDISTADKNHDKGLLDKLKVEWAIVMDKIKEFHMQAPSKSGDYEDARIAVYKDIKKAKDNLCAALPNTDIEEYLKSVQTGGELSFNPPFYDTTSWIIDMGKF